MALTLRDRLKGIYRHIQQHGLFIAPEQDLQFGAPLHSVDIAADKRTQKTTFSVCAESYNANLLFTLLGATMNHTAQLAFGEPGTGKTTAAEFAGHFVLGEDIDKIQQATIYGHPEQTEEKMVAYLSVPALMMGRKEVIVQDFMKIRTKLLDEFPRNPPGKQSIVLQLLDRGFTTYQSERIAAQPGPVYLTANAPDAGSYPMLPPALDRSDIALMALPLNPLYLTRIANDAHFRQDLEGRLTLPEQCRLTDGDLGTLRQEIASTTITPEAMHQLMFFLAELNSCDRASSDVMRKSKGAALYRKPGRALCEGCHFATQGQGKQGHICAYTENPLTQRTMKAVLAYTRAMGWFRGRTQAGSDDLAAVLPYCTWFKLKPTDLALEKDDGAYANDRLAFIRTLWEQSKTGFAKAKQLLEEYDALVTSAGELQTRVSPYKPEYLTKTKELMDKAATLDSVGKYPLLVGLGNLYLAFHTSREAACETKT